MSFERFGEQADRVANWFFVVCMVICGLIVGFFVVALVLYHAGVI